MDFTNYRFVYNRSSYKFDISSSHDASVISHWTTVCHMISVLFFTFAKIVALIEVTFQTFVMIQNLNDSSIIPTL
jgi:hypothetical protein